jgi:hypothetical protein
MKAKIESIGTQSNFVGVDISKDTIDVCYLINATPHYNKFSQTLEGYESFLSIFHMLKCDIVGFESTGVYHKSFEKYLIGNGITPFILPPRSVYHFLKSARKVKGKTDKSDSFGIALYLSKNDDYFFLEFPIKERFKPFVTSLVLYDKQIRQSKNLLHSLKVRGGDDFLIVEIKKMIVSLSKMQSELKDHTIIELYSSIPEAKLIRDEIKGIGDGLMLYLLPIIFDNFDKFTMKQIISFIGIAPVPYESGTSVKRLTHISHSGDNNARKALFMCAVGSVRTNLIIKAKFLRLVEAGKPKKKALVIIMSHILRLVVSRLSHHTKRSIKK